jgi:hypothetical protein
MLGLTRLRRVDIPRVGVPDHLASTLSMAEQYEYLQRRRFGRRRILGVGAVGAGAALASSLVAGRAGAATPTAAPAPAAAERVPGKYVVPFARRLAYGENPRTQMRFGWQVPLAVNRPFLRVGTEPWDLGHKIPAEVRALHSQVGSAAPVDQFYLHAAVDGLTPGRTYYYAVGHEGYDPADPTAVGFVGSFTTAPSRRRVARPFTFTAFGDQGVSYDALGETGAIAAQDPAFHLLAGDIAYADPSGQGLPGDVYDPRTWDQYLAQIEPVASRVPWMVTTGNHDMEALYPQHGYAGQLARWDFPANGPAGCPSVYSYIYGNVGVVSLDANDVSYEIPANLGYSGGSQTRWLADRLRYLRAQPDVDFIVAFFHHCAYSTTNQHASEGGARAEWVPLFDRHRVDLVINGHNHVYERSDPLRGGAIGRHAPIGSTVRPDRDGTTYLTVGGGGRSLYSFPAPDSYAGHESTVDQVTTYSWAQGATKVPETVGWSRVRYTGYGFVAADVQPADTGRTTTLTVRALAENGTELDRVTLARTAGAGSGQRSHLSDSTG